MPVQEIFVLPLLLKSPSTKYYFLYRTLFHLISFHRPATWAGSRAGSPVSVNQFPESSFCAFDQISDNFVETVLF
jgi:hypothetical protein